MKGGQQRLSPFALDVARRMLVDAGIPSGAGSVLDYRPPDRRLAREARRRGRMN